MALEQRVENIESRNKRVEMDKAWETSWTRRFAIAVLTYIVVVLFFLVADLDKPFINPIVPTVGFVLSTFTISRLKQWWIKNK